MGREDPTMTEPNYSENSVLLNWPRTARTCQSCSFEATRVNLQTTLGSVVFTCKSCIYVMARGSSPVI